MTFAPPTHYRPILIHASPSEQAVLWPHPQQSTAHSQHRRKNVPVVCEVNGALQTEMIIAPCCVHHDTVWLLLSTIKKKGHRGLQGSAMARIKIT